MLARQADICLHECVSIYLQIKTLTSSNIIRVPINVKRLVLIVVSQFWTRQARTINVELRRLSIFRGKAFLNKQVQHFDVSLSF